MATNTYVALDTKVLATNTASVTFTNIPQGYTDLVIVGNVTMSGTDGYRVRVGNGTLDTDSNYSYTYLYGTGSVDGSFRGSNDTYGSIGDGTAQIGVHTWNFQNYSNTTTFKTILGRSGTANRDTQVHVNLWRSTQAIDTIYIDTTGSYLAAGSTFTIYGIAADTGSYTAQATGGTVTADQFYVYHTFTSTDTFTPLRTLAADILVVAGGGGSLAAGTGAGPTGGGGAGGLLAFTNQSLSATSYTCTVGAGGINTTGNDSQFGDLTLVKGGGVGGGTDAIGGTGGSGGGSGGRYTSAGGAATSGQGNVGGVGYQQSGLASGGGGGSGQAGWGAANNAGGYGGDGTNAYSTWASATSTGVSGRYAAGGAGMSWYSGVGGTGGAGGGGNGASTSTGTNATNGTANTGSGGGGSSYGSTGGSGIVIIRYPR